jgi:uncharacterized protein (DUF2267 family)
MRDDRPRPEAGLKVLSTVLHKLRDRLPVSSRRISEPSCRSSLGRFYGDQYLPSAQPKDWRTAQEFIHEVDKWLADVRPVDPKEAIAAVFTSSCHIAPGEIEKVRRPCRTRSAMSFGRSSYPKRTHDRMKPCRQPAGVGQAFRKLA